MKDDYLWDGSGEPDTEIERLEKVLGRYRYQPRPLSAAFDQQLLPRRARWWPKLAVAAAIILMALAGIWVVRQHRGAQDAQVIATEKEQPKQEQTGQRQIEQPKPDTISPVATAPSKSLPERKAPVNRDARLAVNPKRAMKPAPDTIKEAAPDRREPAPVGSEIASLQPLMNPFVDIETARHIERAQLFLRSFKNTSDAKDFDADYERQRSRSLLYQNAVLRRDAEAKGNMPVQELLSSVEPFLLDIANLPDKPASDDLRPIKERMQKKEILAALQIYSAPTLSQAF